MSSVLLGKLQEDFKALKRAVVIHDDIRNVLFGEQAVLTANPFLVALRSECPAKLEWQVIDHCASITRLYALYEQFIEEIIREHVDFLPDVYPKYSDLPECIRRQHRTGAGQILQKWSSTSPAYAHLAETTIAGGLVDGLRAAPQYRLLKDAFLLDPENYRSNALDKLFRLIGFENTIGFIQKHPDVVEFISDRFGDQATINGTLDQFVQYRNEAAHGSVNSILSSAELLVYVDFVSVVCKAITDMVLRRVLKLKIDVGHCERLGVVIREFSNQISGVRCDVANWQVGEHVAALKPGIPGSASSVTIISLESDRIPASNLVTSSSQEIGVRFSEKLGLGIELFRILSPHF